MEQCLYERNILSTPCILIQQHKVQFQVFKFRRHQCYSHTLSNDCNLTRFMIKKVPQSITKLKGQGLITITHVPDQQFSSKKDMASVHDKYDGLQIQTTSKLGERGPSQFDDYMYIGSWYTPVEYIIIVLSRDTVRTFHIVAMHNITCLLLTATTVCMIENIVDSKHDALRNPWPTQTPGQ